jgi:hypothetical protein
MLLPEKARIRTIEGYTYGGQTFNEVESAQTPAASKWRIEAEPPAPQKEDLFLTVLFTSEPVTPKLIRDGNKVGAQIADCQVIFDGKAGGTLRIKDKEFTLEAKVKTGKFE